jgi:WD40 repeat protein
MSGTGFGGAKVWDVIRGTVVQVLGAAPPQVPWAAALVGARETSPLLLALLEPKLGRVTVHQGGTDAVAFSPTGRIAVTGGMIDGRVKVWEVASGGLIYSLEEHKGNIEAVAVSPDGRLLLSGDSEGGLKLWDLIRGTQVRSFKGHQGEVRSVAFSRDGSSQFLGVDTGFSVTDIPIWIVEPCSCGMWSVASGCGRLWNLPPNGQLMGAIEYSL